MSMDQKDVEVSQDLLDPFGLRMSLYFAVPQMRFVGCLEAEAAHLVALREGGYLLGLQG